MPLGRGGGGTAGLFFPPLHTHAINPTATTHALRAFRTLRAVSPQHNIVVKQVDRRVVRRDDNTTALVYNTDFTNTYDHPNPVPIRRKNPVFDGRVLNHLGT